MTLAKNCIWCGKDFHKKPSHSMTTWYGRTKYCSRPCAYAGIRATGILAGSNCHLWRGGLEETKKICPECGGRKPRKEAKMCRSCRTKRSFGPDAMNWQGGITPINTAIRNSPEYADWRKAVFERDDYTCVHCGDRGVHLHADHIKPFARFPELRLDVSNGQTLCVPCHKKTDTYCGKGRWQGHVKLNEKALV